MRSLVHRTTKLLEEFIIIQDFEARKLEKLNILLEGLNRRNLSKVYQKVLAEHKNYLCGKLDVNHNYFYSLYKIEINNYNYSKINDKVIKKNNIRKHLNILNNTSIYLTIYYIMHTVNSYVKNLMNCKKYNISAYSNKISRLMEVLNIREIYEIIKGSKYDYLMELYINLLETFQNVHKNTNKFYIKYKSTVELYLKLLSPDEIKFHYTNLINYCNIKENQCPADDFYKMELLSLYEIMLKRKLYIYDEIKYLPISMYRAILLHSLHVGNLSWALEYISKYIKEIDPKYRQNMHNYSMAFFHNYESQYEKSLDYLNKIEQNYFVFKYDLKCLKSIIFYSLGYYENLLDHLHTYKEFLRNDELFSEDLKSYHKSFIFFLRKLVFYNLNIPKDDTSDVIGYTFNKLQKTELILQKDWLQQKYIELKKRKLKAV
jgi:hypothetical protein